VNDLVRAFVALPSPSAAREALERLQGQLLAQAPGGRGAPRGVRPDQLHVTLRFFGDVAPGQLEYLKSELCAAAEGAKPIPVRLRELAAFPNPARARVIAAVLDDAAGSMAALAARMERAAIAVGLPEERRPFRPHVTLIRTRQPAAVNSWLTVAAAEVGPCAFDRVVLFRSVLKPSGPTYSVIEQAALVAPTVS